MILTHSSPVKARRWSLRLTKNSASPARLHTPQYYQVQQNPKMKDNLGTFDSSNEYKYSHESTANITQILLTRM